MKIVYSENQCYEVKQDIEHGNFESCIIKNSNHAKDIIFCLVCNGTPFHKINYGGGVYKLIKNDGHICDKCLGKGLIE